MNVPDAVLKVWENIAAIDVDTTIYIIFSLGSSFLLSYFRTDCMQSFIRSATLSFISSVYLSKKKKKAHAAVYF